MSNPSISIPDWMVDEIHERREKGTNRSQYIREAIQARFDAEDAGLWERPDVEPPTNSEAPADD